MVVLIGIIIFAAVIGFYACFGRRINENIGSGFGKEYMKDKWGNGRIMKECRMVYHPAFIYVIYILSFGRMI